MAQPPEETGEAVGRRTFSTSFRGFDQNEVRAYLAMVADEFVQLQARIAELESQLEVARRPVERPPVDVASLTAALGEETANVLRVARETADELRTRAEEGAARTLREAHEEATRIRSAAESVLAERNAEADQAGARLIAVAEEEASRLRRQAAAESEATIADAIATGKDMVGQAQAARERVLADLARRRNSGLHQLELLRAGRERLTAGFEATGAEVVRILAELAAAEADAAEIAETVSPKGNGASSAARADRPASAGAPVAQIPSDVVAPASPATGDLARVGDAPVAAEPVAAPSVAESSPGEPGTAAATVEEPEAAAPATVDDAGPPPGYEPLFPDPAPQASADGVPETGERTTSPADADAATADTATADAGAGDGGVEAGDDGDARAAALTSPDDAGPASAEGAGPASAEGAGPASAEGAGPGPVPADAAVAAVDGPAGGSAPEAEAGSPSVARAAYAHDPVPVAVLSGPAVGDAPPDGRVDQLFARIRADRLEPAVAVEDLPTQAVAVVNDEEETLEPRRSDADEAYLQERDVLVENALASTSRALKRALADDQNAALEHLRTLRSPAVTLGDLTEDAAVQARGWGRAATPGLIEAAAAGARLGGGNPPADLAAVAMIAERLAMEIAQPLRARLAAAIEASDGERDDATTDRINGAFREARSRVDDAVGDAVTDAVAAGFVAAVEPGIEVRWVVDDAGGPCADCDDNALAGGVPLGDAFPTGQSAPPAHPGCRCILMRTTT